MAQIITGGIENSLVRLLEQLVKHEEYELSVLVYRPVVEPIYRSFLVENKIPLYVVADKKSNPRVGLFKRKWRFKRHLRQQDVIVDYFNCSFAHDILRSGSTAIKIGWYHSGFAAYMQNVCLQHRLFARTYDLFVTPTASFLRDLVAFDPSMASKTRHVYNPIDVELVRSKAALGECPTAGERYFSFPARLHSDKDHETVISAVEMMRKRVPDVKVYFIGDGDKREELEREVAARGLEKNITFTGNLTNPFGYMAHAVANILASHGEGLGNTMVESMALGTLNIATDCPSGPAEVLLEGKAGLLVPHEDAAALAAAMERVWNAEADDGDIQSMLYAASESLARFAPASVAAHTQRLFNLRKRIGILNFHFEGENYGAVLTSYALNKYLNSLGCKAENIDYTAWFYMRHGVQGEPEFERFRARFLPMSVPVTSSDIATMDEQYDAFVVGSDQVFNQEFVRDEQNVYFLGFTDKTKVAYAASLGTERLNGDPAARQAARSLLCRFHALSVREDVSAQGLSAELHKPVSCMPDPVFLLDWEELCVSPSVPRKAVWYVLHPELRALAGEENLLHSGTSVQEWLGSIRDADCVITDSFHGMCFSLIFGKPFVPLCHTGASPLRILSLFRMFGIPSDAIRFVGADTPKDMQWMQYAVQPQTAQTRAHIMELRCQADIFLSNALNIK